MKHTALIVLCVVISLIGILCACQHADVPIIDTYTDEPIPTLERPYYSFTPKPSQTPYDDEMLNLKYEFVEPIDVPSNDYYGYVPLFFANELFEYNEYIIRGSITEMRELHISFEKPLVDRPGEFAHNKRYYTVVTVNVIKSYGKKELPVTNKDGTISFLFPQATNSSRGNVLFVDVGDECFVWLCNMAAAQAGEYGDWLCDVAPYSIILPEIQIVKRYGDNGYNAARLICLTQETGKYYISIPIEQMDYWSLTEMESFIQKYVDELNGTPFNEMIKKRGYVYQ